MTRTHLLQRDYMTILELERITLAPVNGPRGITDASVVAH